MNLQPFRVLWAAVLLVPAGLFAATTVPATPSKAVFTEVRGQVSIRVDERTRPARVGTVVKAGESIELSGKDAYAALRTDDGTRIRLAGSTRLRFEELSRGTGKTAVTRLRLLAGTVWAKVAKLRTKASAFEIKAGGVVCGVRGTTLAGRRSADGKSGGFYNFEGRVFVSDGKRDRMIGKGRGCSFENGLLGEFVDIPEDLKELNQGSDRDPDGSLSGLDDDLSELSDQARDTESNMTGIQVDQVHAIDLLFDSPENSQPVGGGQEVMP